MSSHTIDVPDAREIEQTRWRIDPARSRIEFTVRSNWGLSKVRGQFVRYDGTLDLASDTAVELAIEPTSIDTKNKRRDKHLLSPAFFDAGNHPLIRFSSESATLRGTDLKLRGTLHAGGRSVPLDIDATVRREDDELVLDAAAEVDQRLLGMSWSPLGIVRTPSLLAVHVRLISNRP